MGRELHLVEMEQALQKQIDTRHEEEQNTMSNGNDDDKLNGCLNSLQTLLQDYIQR